MLQLHCKKKINFYLLCYLLYQPMNRNNCQIVYEEYVISNSDCDLGKPHRPLFVNILSQNSMDISAIQEFTNTI